MKILFKISLISALLLGSAYANDLLSSLTNGKISDNSAGVRVLNLDEMKEVELTVKDNSKTSINEKDKFKLYDSTNKMWADFKYNNFAKQELSLFISHAK